MLLHLPNVLTPEQVQTMRQQLMASDEWVDGRETVGAQGAEVKRNQQLASRSALKAELGKQILQALANNPLFFAAALPAKIMPPLFNRYSGGGTYGFHVDGSVMKMDNGEQMRSDLSCTIFFNEPDTYEGGELIVADTYGEHEVKLPAGDAILYPSSSLHCVSPVTQGERLASFFWIQSMVRDVEQRRMLFEMDTSITQLRNTQADRDATLQLTGIYHNLLRRWSEV